MINEIVRGRVTRLLGVFDSLRWDMRTQVQLYAAVFEVESDDEPRYKPLEWSLVRRMLGMLAPHKARYAAADAMSPLQ